MRYPSRRPMTCRSSQLTRRLLVLVGVLALSQGLGTAQECPEWSLSGTIDSGDESTVPGQVGLYSTCCPAPTNFYGLFDPG